MMTQYANPFILGKNTIRYWMIPNIYYKRDNHEGPNRSKKHDRREFISGLAPTLALTYLDVKTVMPRNPDQEDPAQQISGYKFNKEFPGPKMTYWQDGRCPTPEFHQVARFLQKRTW